MTRVPIPRLSGPPTDGTITLRDWPAADGPAVARAYTDSEIQRWTEVPAFYEEEYARQFLEGREESRRLGQTLEMAIADARSLTMLGSVGLVSFDAVNRRGEVGYWVAPQGRGRGVATAAVRLLSSAAFAQLDLIRLDLIAAVGNVASLRVAEKAGFTREGVMRSYLANKQDRRDDAVMFGLVRGD